MDGTRASYGRITTLMALAKLITTADFTIISVALPSIGRDLGVAPALLSWVVVANSLAIAGLLVIGGRLVDRLGHRTVLTVGLALFGGASLAAALAPSIEWLFAARAAQGAAVALVSPSSFALITAFVPDGPERHKALGVFGTTQGLSLILGLLVGGLVTTTLGWRAVFVINLPLIAIAIVMALRVVPAHVRGAAQPIDVAGALTGSLMIVALVSGVSAMGRLGPLDPQALGALLGAVALFGLFALIERRAAAPIVPPTLFRRDSFGLAVAASLLFMAGVGGLFVLTQLYMQRVLGFTAFDAGLGMMPYALAVIGAGHVAPRLLHRFAPRDIVLAAAAVNAAGLLFLAATLGQPYALSIAIGYLICPLGSVSAFLALMQAATAGLRSEEQGVGSAVLFTAQSVGVALGASVTLALIGGRGAEIDIAGFRLAFIVLAGGVGIAFAATLLAMRGRRPVIA